jgi:hypothetical protein
MAQVTIALGSAIRSPNRFSVKAQSFDSSNQVTRRGAHLVTGQTESSETSSAVNCLSGGSEMGAIDGSKTSIGAP